MQRRLISVKMVNFKMPLDRFEKLQEAVRKCKWLEARSLSDFVRQAVDAAVDAKLADPVDLCELHAKPKKPRPISAIRRRKSGTR